MSCAEGIIDLESDNSLSFGDYLKDEKQKCGNFEAFGNVFSVKTWKEITRLEKNSKLLFESVPGCNVKHFLETEKSVSFKAEGFKDTEITLELEPNSDYKILIDGVNVGSTKSNISGKISFSMELSQNERDVKIERSTI